MGNLSQNLSSRIMRVCGTYTLPEHQETYTDDFGGETDALRPRDNVSWRKILQALTHSVVRPGVTARRSPKYLTNTFKRIGFATSLSTAQIEK